MTERNAPKGHKGHAHGYDYRFSVSDTLGDPTWPLTRVPSRHNADTDDEGIDDGLAAIEERLKDGADELGYVSHGDVEWLIALVRAVYREVSKT